MANQGEVKSQMNPVSLYDLEAMAEQVMPHHKWTFVDAGAADEITVRRNREAFDEITVTPDSSWTCPTETPPSRCLAKR